MDTRTSPDRGVRRDIGDAERGATAVEYGIMLAAVAAVIVAVALSMGGQIFSRFESFHVDLVALLSS